MGVGLRDFCSRLSWILARLHCRRSGRSSSSTVVGNKEKDSMTLAKVSLGRAMALLLESETKLAIVKTNLIIVGFSVRDMALVVV